jgi:methylated-DNA-protein-cysteine methyltransferase-like protein
MTEKHWTEKIYDLVRQIPRGKVTTYGTLAEKVGARTTSRMVGWAMNASHTATPKVPAHRVVNRNGLLTGKHHFGSPTLMEELLRAEGVEVKEDQIVDFKKHLFLFDHEG